MQRFPTLWQELRRASQTQRRRIVPQTLALGILGGFLLALFRILHPPARSTIAWSVNLAVWALSTATVGLLVSYAVEAFRICIGFIHPFALEPTAWRLLVLTSPYKQRKLPADTTAERLDLIFIAERTSVVGSLIHYPLVALFLVVAALSRIFDDWSYATGLLRTVGATAAHVFTSAILLCVAAEKATSTAIKRLIDPIERLRAKAQEPGQAERCVHQSAHIDQMRHDIAGIRQGAFAHRSQHPLLQALVLPSGGFRASALLDYFHTQ